MVSTYESVQGWERKAWNLFKPWYFWICTLGWLMRILFFHSFLFSCIFKPSSWYCQTVFRRICKYFWIQEIKWKCCKCPHMSRANCRSPYFSKLHFILSHNIFPELYTLFIFCAIMKTIKCPCWKQNTRLNFGPASWDFEDMCEKSPEQNEEKWDKWIWPNSTLKPSLLMLSSLVRSL